MTGIVTIQQLKNASADAESLERILNDAEWVEVETRLGRKVYSIATINALINKLNTDVVKAIDDLQTAIDIALEAGAGAAGWTTLLVFDGVENQHQINRKTIRHINSVDELNNKEEFLNIYADSYHPDLKLGSGNFKWIANFDKSKHDGCLVIDPLRFDFFPTDWTDSAQVQSWITPSSSGLGCWVKLISNAPTIFDYGFFPDSQLHRVSNTLLFQKALDINSVVRVPFYNRPLFVTKNINVKNGRHILCDSEYMNESLWAEEDMGIIGDGTGPVFSTGTYPATANTNRQLHFTRLKARTLNYPVLDLIHSDDAVLDDCLFHTFNAPAVRQIYSARVRYLGGHYASYFDELRPDNFAIKMYDNCNASWISPTTVISGGTFGGGVDVTQSQRVVIDGIYETCGGYGIRMGGYSGSDLQTWQTSKNYKRGDQVQNNSNAWVCVVDHVSTAFVTDSGKWKVINGNCGAPSIAGYLEAIKKPLSIGARNLVLSPTLGKTGLHINTQVSASDFIFELGAVTGLCLHSGCSILKAGTEPTIRFTQPTTGSSVTDYLTGSTIKNLNIQGGGPDYENLLSNLDLIGYVYGRNEIQLTRNGITSGTVREYISPTIIASTGLISNAFILDTGNGGVIDAIEIINVNGAIGCSLRVGHPALDGENLVVDPSTLTIVNGAATTSPVLALIRPNKTQTIRVIAGTGTGSFRVRIKYRI